MSSRSMTPFSVTEILRIETSKPSGNDISDASQTPKLVGSTSIVEEDTRELENASTHKASDEASNIPFSVEAILRLESSNSSKHKTSDERPKTPFSVEDILRIESPKSPKLKSCNEITKMEGVPTTESPRWDNTTPNTHLSVEEVYRKEPTKATESTDKLKASSSAHKLRAALMKSSGYSSIEEASCCSDAFAFRCLSPCSSKIWIPTSAYRWHNFSNAYKDRIIPHQNSENISSSLNGDLGDETFRPMTPGLHSRGKCQIRFTLEQTAALEKEFGDHRYISPEQRRIIAMQIQLSEKQVKTWFQNRRAKWKKQRLFESGVGSPCYFGPLEYQL